MRYDCKQISEILAGSEGVMIDEDAFLEHVERCAGCRLLVKLDPALEDALENALPEPAPPAISQNLTKMAAVDSRYRRRHRRIAILRRHLANLAVGLTLLILALNFEIIAKINQYLTSAVSQASSLLSFEQWSPAILLSYLDQFLHSPLFLVALIEALLLTWSFAILGLRETSK